jgi:hypothetical protein
MPGLSSPSSSTSSPTPHSAPTHAYRDCFFCLHQPDRPIWRRVYARGASQGPLPPRPHRSLLPHGRHILHRDLVRPDIHPLLHHPHRPGPHNAPALEVARSRFPSSRRRPLLPALLDVRAYPRLEE